MPRVSIVTASYNALPALEYTARSLFGQCNTDFEWLVVDGASIDGTPAWLAATARSRPRLRWISEPDRGIYDALNKALAMVRGQWVLFLGAGDTLVDDRVLEECGTRLDGLADTVTLAYGGVMLTQVPGSTEGVLCYVRWTGTGGRWVGARPAMPCHQGIFHRRELFDTGFRFDDRLPIAADAELVLRELLAGRGRDLDRMVACMVQGGASTARTRRLALIWESILVNRRVGIFWSRPLHQLIILCGNLVKHPWRLVRARWRKAHHGP